ncbi:hypothetical protein GQ457_03G033690 [Hibiscus cannabinus]
MEGKEPKPEDPTMRTALLVINCVILTVGNSGGSLISRVYFVHGGKRIWFSSWLQTAAWPIYIFIIAGAYMYRSRTTEPTSENKLFYMKPSLFIASAVIGILTGLDNYFYAYGVSLLPVSTCNLILASQLAFTAGFAFLLVKQKFSAYSINAVFLLTIGAGILAVPTSGDEAENESKREYTVGFLMTLAAAALYGLVLPLVELMYQKANQEITYALVLEIQLVTSVFATAFCTIGMLVNNDFKVIGREAREFDLGETKYYVVAISSAILWQGYFLGGIGIVFCASSLLSGMVTAIQLPILEILAVIFFREKFEAEKGLSLVLSLWGFLSYFYADIKKLKRMKRLKQKQKQENPETDMKSVELRNNVDSGV